MRRKRDETETAPRVPDHLWSPDVADDAWRAECREWLDTYGRESSDFRTVMLYYRIALGVGGLTARGSRESD